MKKLLRFFLLFIYLTCSACKENNVAQALSQIVRDFYVQKSEKFDFVTFSSSPDNLDDLVDQVIKESRVSFSYQVVKVRESNETVKINQSAILIFDNIVSYFKFHRRPIYVNKYWKMFHFVVYIAELLENEKSLISSSFVNPSSLLQYESFLMETKNKSLVLMNYKMFQQPNCREWKNIVVNEYSTNLNAWKTKVFFPEKLQTFNGCEMVVVVMLPAEPIAGVDFDKTGKMIKAWGYGIEMNEEIGRNLNYTSVYNPFFIKNESLHNKTMWPDFYIYSLRLRLIPGMDCAHTHVFTTVEDFFLITKGKLFTPFEKLFLPFDDDVWMWMIITLAVALTTIFILKLTAKKYQNFVFGSKVNSPIMNML